MRLLALALPLLVLSTALLGRAQNLAPPQPGRQGRDVIGSQVSYAIMSDNPGNKTFDFVNGSVTSTSYRR
jgi:hypothetical protein